MESTTKMKEETIMHTKKSKIFTSIFALLLILGTLLPMFGALKQVSASTVTTTIKITNPYKGATYKMWKILDATETDQFVNGTDGAKKLTYTVPDASMRTALAAVLNINTTSKTDTAIDQEIIQKISDIASNSADARTFAHNVYEKIKNNSASFTKTTADANSFSWAPVPSGYYILAEDNSAVNPKPSPYQPSLTILKTIAPSYGTVDENVSTIDITMKRDGPTVEKKILEDGNIIEGQTGYAAPTYGKVADHEIGDVVHFRLKATVPDNVAEFKLYKLTFNDTLSKGLTYQKDAKVYHVAKDKVNTLVADDKTTLFNVSGATEITSKATITAKDTSGNAVAETPTTATKIKIDFAKLYTSDETTDSAEAVPTLAAGDVIVVEYSAVLNKNAVIGGAGNLNTVNLNFSTDPYANDGGTPGTTPDDTVVDFTFQLDVNKVDGKNTPLKGATFTLYRYTAKATDTDFSATTTGWAEVSEIVGSDASTFNFKGLEKGKYKLVETTAPDGYNKAADIDFEVVPTYDNSNPPKLTKLEIKNDTAVLGSTDATSHANGTKVFTMALDTGKATTTVINNVGKELPSTGGMGTVILYTAGAILAVGAGVYLIIKRRTTVK